MVVRGDIGPRKAANEPFVRIWMIWPRTTMHVVSLDLAYGVSSSFEIMLELLDINI